MSSLIDLLPRDRSRSLRQIYFVRLATVLVLLTTGVTIVHSVLLLPSYLYADGLVRDRKAELSRMAATLAASEEREIGDRVSTLASDAGYLAALATTPKAAAAISAILALPREGVRLAGFSFASAPEGATMQVSGVASSREALRGYEQVLRGQSFITSATLPISAYAKERDIEFTITLAGPFLP